MINILDRVIIWYIIAIKELGLRLEDQVKKFLLEFKGIAIKDGVDTIPRKDTRATLQYLGLTYKNLQEILLSLSVEDYCEGPLEDHSKPGELWVFGKEVKGQEVYIKLKVADVSGVRIAKCISFHIPVHPMEYPFCKG